MRRERGEGRGEGSYVKTIFVCKYVVNAALRTQCGVHAPDGVVDAVKGMTTPPPFLLQHFLSSPTPVPRVQHLSHSHTQIKGTGVATPPVTISVYESACPTVHDPSSFLHSYSHILPSPKSLILITIPASNEGILSTCLIELFLGENIFCDNLIFICLCFDSPERY